MIWVPGDGEKDILDAHRSPDNYERIKARFPDVAEGLVEGDREIRGTTVAMLKGVRDELLPEIPVLLPDLELDQEDIVRRLNGMIQEIEGQKPRPQRIAELLCYEIVFILDVMDSLVPKEWADIEGMDKDDPNHPDNLEQMGE